MSTSQPTPHRHVAMCLLLALLPTCAQEPPEPASPAWHEGGTLQDATIARWRGGTTRDRLATAADFFQETHRAWVMTHGRGALKLQAAQLTACINERSLMKSIQTRRVSELAVACMNQDTFK